MPRYCDLHCVGGEADEAWKTFIRLEDLGWKLGKMGYSSLLSVLQPEEAMELLFCRARG